MVKYISMFILAVIILGCLTMALINLYHRDLWFIADLVMGGIFSSWLNNVINTDME